MSCWPALTARPIRWSGSVGWARLILQQALEDEVSEFLGRARYERAIDPCESPQRLRAADGRDDSRAG
jgi:hypothetical protein